MTASTQGFPGTSAGKGRTGATGPALRTWWCGSRSRYESVLAAAALGGALWAVAGGVGWRLLATAERRGVVATSFVVVYATTLVLLYILASSIWRMEECLTD